MKILISFPGKPISGLLYQNSPKERNKLSADIVSKDPDTLLKVGLKEAKEDVKKLSDEDKVKLQEKTIEQVKKSKGTLSGALAKLWELLSKLFKGFGLEEEEEEDEEIEDTPKNRDKREKAAKDLEMSPSKRKSIRFLKKFGRFENKTHKRRLSSLDPKLLDVMVDVVKKYGKGPLISGTVRTIEDNEALIVRRLKSGRYGTFSEEKIKEILKSGTSYKIVGVAADSDHMYGDAVDFGSGSIPKPKELEKFILQKYGKGKYDILVHQPGPHLHLGLVKPKIATNKLSNADLKHQQEQFDVYEKAHVHGHNHEEHT